MSGDLHRAFSWRKALALSAAAAFAAAALSIVVQTEGPRLAGLLVPVTPAASEASASSGAEGWQGVSAKPARLVIPSIGVDAYVQSVGLSWKGNGEMGIPTNFDDVAWYNGGPVPGAPGSAVIDGHLDGKETPRAVFYDLAKLRPGDEVKVIDERGDEIRFLVVAVRTYGYQDSAADVFGGDASKARLNLITCGGEWIGAQHTYDTRVVVFTERA